MIAFVWRFSGVRAVVTRCKDWLGTANFSSLSPALDRVSSLAFVKRLVEVLQARHRPGRHALVILDGMALSLAKTQRHRCRKMNNKTVGGGVVWAYMVEAFKGACPIKVLRIVEGAWHDAVVMRTVELVARGPLYVMDRGFYAFDLLEKWLKEKVHFVVRARSRGFLYSVERHVSTARRVGDARLVLDARVRLGGAQAKLHPRVRLVMAILASGDTLALVTDLADWSAERILAAYKKRWHVERFHRLLKDTLGLAHLYSFGQSGIAFLLYTALLLSLLLFLSAQGAADETIVALRKALRALRSALGLGTPWKRNSCTVSRSAKKKDKLRAENH
jgi:hypothetical protein